MKKIFLLGTIFSVMLSSAQHNPKLEADGHLVKATYFHENGKVAQQGYFKDGKASGQWASFDEQGNKQSIGNYASGEKTGKWFFWNKENLSEVDYSDSRIASVKKWSQEVLVKN